MMHPPSDTFQHACSFTFLLCVIAAIPDGILVLLGMLEQFVDAHEILVPNSLFLMLTICAYVLPVAFVIAWILMSCICSHA